MQAVGVDAAVSGWLAVSLVDGRYDRAVLVPSLADVIEAFPSAAAYGVDIPIGLADVPGRVADLEARKLLGSRASAVFPTYPREVLALTPDYDAARALCRSRGWPVLSKQSFALAARILEVERHAADERVFEVHPELSFLMLTGEPLESKKTWNGLRRRLAALASAGIEPPDRMPARVLSDDVVDACIAAWSAVRFARGEAEPLPTWSRARVGAMWR